MNFFNDIDGLELLEDQAQAVTELEAKEARQILNIYKRVALTLYARMKSFASADKRDATRMSYFQVEAAIQAIEASLNKQIPNSMEIVANLATGHLQNELQTFERMASNQLVPININAMRIASKTNNFLINTYKSSIDTYSKDLRDKIGQGLQDSIGENLDWEQTVQNMLGFFGGEEWRLRRIVRTELHNIYGRAKMFGMEEARSTYFPDLKKTLYNPMDARTGEDSIYLESLKLIVDIDEPFRYKWKGKWRVFFAVDRPNDRSIVIPYRPSWG